VPKSLPRARARHAALVANGLLPVTALAVNVAVLVARIFPTLATIAAAGVIIDALGARTAGLGIAVVALVLVGVEWLALVVVSIASDATQLWLRWARGQDFIVLYTRGWSFYRTVWAGIRGTNRLYQRRLGYRQLDL
jgi:hypothetical protein